jgi:hypothetical protein
MVARKTENALETGRFLFVSNAGAASWHGPILYY